MAEFVVWSEESIQFYLVRFENT